MSSDEKNNFSPKSIESESVLETSENLGENLRENLDFPVVGVGASAGGLEAFEQLLTYLPVDTGMAFILVQHLAPTRESLLIDILSKKTVLPICEVTDGMVVKPNNIYVLPPNERITLVSGALRLISRDLGGESYTLIDEFFISLANELKENAVGVILSGTGSDGARGIEAITASGGATFAQDRNSAKFDGMPSAAIAKGVDFVLTPQEIAKELAIISQSIHHGILMADEVNKKSSMQLEHNKKSFKKILDSLFKTRGIDFSHYKTPTIQRRVIRRMAIHRLATHEDYALYLQQHPSEIDSLYEDLLIKVTSFFRDAECFEVLKTNIFPHIFEKKERAAPVRIWVPGCATGEEAYSIAICLMEYLEEKRLSQKIEIFATDISETALTKARSGEFSHNIAENVSDERLKRYFVKTESGYRIISTIRECCVFAKQNLIRDPPFSRLDLISCRNLLIYLAPNLQKRILSTFHFALNEYGFLLLGSAETIGSTSELFDVSEKSSKIFSRRRTCFAPSTPEFAMDAFGERAQITTIPAVTFQNVDGKTDIKTDVDKVIQTKFIPPGVVINERMEVIQFRGDTSPYLVHPPGELTANFFKMCREDLMLDIRAAIHEAGATGETTKKDGWVKTSGDELISIEIIVIPFFTTTTKQRHFIILFSRRAETKKLADSSGEENVEICRLQRELADTKDYLNALLEKEHATNEELKSASEEILSANEELQSTNEEMATAKEETQAANDELTTVNEELLNRSKELTRVSSDLTNLFSSVQIPIIMLSEKLQLQLITPSAEKVLNLSSSDIGKSLADIASKLNFQGLEKLSYEVLETLNTKEQEVQDKNGKWYLLRVKPYRTIDNKIDGAVIALLDIDVLKRANDMLEIERDYANAIIQTTPTPLLILGGDLRVITANDAFYRYFQINAQETIGESVFSLGKEQRDSTKLRKLLEEILPNDNRLENFELTDEFPSIGKRTMRLNARRLVQSGGEAKKILLAIDDITDEKRSQDRAEAAKDIAEAATRAKSDFLANISHEIRTPLASIMGYSELLSDPYHEKETAVECASKIARHVDQLTTLIDEILDISKIEAGKFEVDRIKFALLPVLAETFIPLQALAREKGLSFNITFNDYIPEFITSCPMRLRQILSNIIGNALKFTDKGHLDIDIDLVKNPTTLLRFTISDTGCGLSPDQQERIFQSFTQADASVTRKYGGTGLGLVLARRFAQALGGEVVLTNSSFGQGSVFTISIDPGPLDDVSLLKGLSKFDLDSRHAETHLPWTGVNRRLSDMHILLVDDGEDNQMLMAHFLKESGAVVDIAHNGDEAIEKIKAHNYDLVFMDIQMPILDGYEATRRIKAAGYETPIIALTAHAMRGERERCLEAGCVAYISKPVKANALIDIAAEFGKKERSKINKKSFRSLLDNDPAVGPLILQFVQNLSERTNDLYQAIERGDEKELCVLAHQMSGAAGSYGFPEIGEIAARLEAKAKKSADSKQLKQLVDEFDVKSKQIIAVYAL